MQGLEQSARVLIRIDLQCTTLKIARSRMAERSSRRWMQLRLMAHVDVRQFIRGFGNHKRQSSCSTNLNFVNPRPSTRTTSQHPGSS